MFRYNDFCLVQMIPMETLNNAIADVVWWFGFSAEEINNWTVKELDDWLAQANRQVKAGYVRA